MRCSPTPGDGRQVEEDHLRWPADVPPRGRVRALRGSVRAWLTPPSSSAPGIRDARARRLVVLELLVVLTVTFGSSALRSALALLDAVLAPIPLAQQQVTLNAPAARAELVDLAVQLTGVLQLLGWGALGAYLLIRAGITPGGVGLDRTRPGRDLLGATGLAVLIGVPGLGLYLLARATGFSLTVAPSTLDEAWWQIPLLVASAAANGWAEEVVAVALLLTRLRQLGWSDNRALGASALLRASYHLYQGPSAFVGNLVMGLVFGRVWQRTSRLWILVGAHTLINIVAFAGYAVLAGRVSWLP